MLDDDDSYCEVSFSPNVDLLTAVRRFVAELFVRVLDDAAVTARLVVATNELLENSARYSVDGQSSIRIAVQQAGGEIKVSIETKNRTREPDRQRVDELLAEMRASSDREMFYQTLITRSAKRATGSGLGLGRIHAESRMDLSCELHEDVFRVHAEARFPAKPNA